MITDNSLGPLTFYLNQSRSIVDDKLQQVFKDGIDEEIAVGCGGIKKV
jgi:hypothetical protein